MTIPDIWQTKLEPKMPRFDLQSTIHTSNHQLESQPKKGTKSQVWFHDINPDSYYPLPQFASCNNNPSKMVRIWMDALEHAYGSK